VAGHNREAVEVLRTQAEVAERRNPGAAGTHPEVAEVAERRNPGAAGTHPEVAEVAERRNPGAAGTHPEVGCHREGCWGRLDTPGVGSLPHLLLAAPTSLSSGAANLTNIRCTYAISPLSEPGRPELVVVRLGSRRCRHVAAPWYA
jgi:hypothetical protein